METNNPPNATGFAKKSPARNKCRYHKRKTAQKPVNLDLLSEDDRKAFNYLVACVFIVCAATVLKDMFDKPNAD